MGGQRRTCSSPGPSVSDIAASKKVSEPYTAGVLVKSLGKVCVMVEQASNQVCPVYRYPAYVRLQAERCQRLSRNCMDLGTARDLRLMAEEYFAEASSMEVRNSGLTPH